MEHFDYIIIGAGSAGCVLADRLSADGKARVLLLESGPADRSLWIHMPAGYGKLFYHSRLNYRFFTEPQPTLGNRQDYYPRGRVVGGSGAINAMVYCRGLPRDFDDWERSGASGWGWAAVRETYEKIETLVAPDGSSSGTGPMHVSDVRHQVHPMNRHFFTSLDECQLPQTDNINDPEHEGGTVYRINTKKGRRWSAAQAFLAPATTRRNLVRRTSATVNKVVIIEGQATGVDVLWKGKTHRIAAGEVILSAGSVQSPTILQRSGVGPAELLARHGIEIVKDNPNVGGNLQDHLGVNYFFKSNEPTLNNTLAPWYGKILAGIQYMLTRKGPLSLSVNQCGGFFRSSEDRPAPDQQLYFNPVTYTTTRVGERNVINPDPFPGFILGMQPCRPSSRGRIDISDAGAESPPHIQPNSLSTPEDTENVVAGGRLCARIMSAPTMRKLVFAPMYRDVRCMTDEDILDDFRNRCGSVFHPVSTCRMGQDAANSVTDPMLKVHGVKNLRVVDASVFPNVTSGNTNAPTMMLAYRAADLILQTGS
jgi:choline dehydrogenase